MPDLGHPLVESRRVFERARPIRVCVAISGGKDSIATMDIVSRNMPKAFISGFHMSLIPGLECEWRFIRVVERRYGIKVLETPHYSLSHLMRDGVLRHPDIRAESIPKLKQADVENVVRRMMGGEDVWFAWGNRAADSIVRNAYLKRILGVDQAARRIYPIWTWKRKDVFAYLHARQLPTPQSIGGLKDMGGVSLRKQHLRWIRDNYPEDFRKILEVFPLAEAWLFHADLHGDGARKVYDRWNERGRKEEAKQSAPAE